MIRAQSVVAKNKKKSHSSSQSSKVKKKNGAKSEINDNNQIKTNVVQNKKLDGKLSNKVQEESNIGSEPHLEETTTNKLIDLDDRQLERSNSFSLTRKLSKIYKSLTNSRESLKDNNVNLNHDKKPPFKFTRSVSLATISLKKDYRNSMRKPRLEQLSEEDHPFGVPVEKSKRKYDKKASTASIDSLSSRTSDISSIISSFKRTFSLTPSRRKSTNPKWSASLMSLQQIDVMISYEDLSFIDYDKFNTYEENLMTKMKSTNQGDLNSDQFPVVKMRSRADTSAHSQRRHSTVIQATSDTNEGTIDWMNVESKRWSNPCISQSITECTSYASVVKAQPTDDIDECDCSASNDCFIRTNVDSMNAVHSVDDLTAEVNEHTKYVLQMVSGFNLQLFCSLLSTLFLVTF